MIKLKAVETREMVILLLLLCFVSEPKNNPIRTIDKPKTNCGQPKGTRNKRAAELADITISLKLAKVRYLSSS